MAVQFYTPEQFERFKTLLKKRKTAFEYVRTQKKQYIKLGGVRYYYSQNPEEDKLAELPPASLGLIVQTKNEVLRNYQHLGPFEDCLNVDYFSGTLRPYQLERLERPLYIGKKFGRKMEYKLAPRQMEPALYKAIDLSGAYLTTALNMGLISKETYKKFYWLELDKKERQRKKKLGLKMYFGHNGEIYKHSKICRLIALGALATKKEVTKYFADGTEESRQEYEEEQANIFYKIAKETGLLMAEAAERFGAAFYFVDCIFTPIDKAEAASEWLRAKGYSLNSKEGYLEQFGSSFKFSYPDKETGEEKTKEYSLPPSKSLDLRREFSSSNWLEDFTKEVKADKELLGWLNGEEGEERKQIAREKIASSIIKEFPFLSDFKSLQSSALFDMKHIAKRVGELGLSFGDLFSLAATTTTTKKIWGEELPIIAAYTKVYKTAFAGLQADELEPLELHKLEEGNLPQFEEKADILGLPVEIQREVSLKILPKQVKK